MKLPIFPEGVPRKTGVRGQAAYEHRRSQVLVEGGPRRFFGAFLIVQKGTPVPKIKRDGHRAIPKKR